MISPWHPWAILTGEDIMIQEIRAVCWLLPAESDPTPLAVLALHSVGFVCDPTWDLITESRGIYLSPQLLPRTHNARAHCSSSLATHCRETDVDVTVPAPEIFAQPSRETLCNHTQAGIIYKLNHEEWWCPKLGSRNRV